MVEGGIICHLSSLVIIFHLSFVIDRSLSQLFCSNDDEK
jgi:hypothetical protein